MKRVNVLFLLAAIAAPSTASATTTPMPVSPPASMTGIPASEISQFATGITFFDPAARAEGTPASDFGPTVVASNAFNALGAPDGATVSLGDRTNQELIEGRFPGEIVLEFDNAIFDGPGADIAIFENAQTFFADPFIFAELAFVEVSSNGVDFARFEAESLNIRADDAIDQPNELDEQFGFGFAGLNTTFVRNLAGVHQALEGTPFDLAELTTNSLVVSGDVDLQAIRFVRIVDIPGTGFFTDIGDRPIFDASLTTGTGGFDLDAVGALNVVPEPSALVLAIAGCPLAVRRRRQG